MTVIIRKAKIRDLDTIMQFERELFSTEQMTYAASYPGLEGELETRGDADSCIRQFYRGLIYSGNGLILVAEEEGRPVGFLAAYVRKNIPLFTRRRFVEVTDIWIDEEERGSGIGTRLMDEAASWCRRKNITTLSLKVLAHNAGAMAFYREYGFLPFTITLRKELAIREECRDPSCTPRSLRGPVQSLPGGRKSGP